MRWLRLPRTGSSFKVSDLSESRLWQLLVPLLQRHFRGSWWTGQEYINQDLVVSWLTSKMAFMISFQYNAGEQTNIKMSFASRYGFTNKSRAIDCMLKHCSKFKISESDWNFKKWIDESQTESVQDYPDLCCNVMQKMVFPLYIIFPFLHLIGVSISCSEKFLLTIIFIVMSFYMQIMN